MITKITCDRLVVISDLHLGNPFSNASKKAIPFIRWAAKNGYDICINGDGLEIAQASFFKIASEVPELLRCLVEVRESGREVYYCIGNHDIMLEHFLEDWGVLKVSPFLNIASGDKRIRIEHGHIYDPFFVSFPRLYETLTHFGGYLLKVWPPIYRAWIKFEEIRSRLRARRSGILGEHPNFGVAAEEISLRGFDYVIFGHTHHVGIQKLESGALYLNPGSWMLSTNFVQIDRGHVEMKDFTLLQPTLN